MGMGWLCRFVNTMVGGWESEAYTKVEAMRSLRGYCGGVIPSLCSSCPSEHRTVVSSVAVVDASSVVDIVVLALSIAAAVAVFVDHHP